MKSARLSFKGYRFSEALYRNKDSLKGVLTVLVGYSTYLTATTFDYKAFLLALGVSAGAFVGKLIFDAFDFYFSEVEL